MSNYTRRRFITDLLFVGGAIAAAAGLAVTGESAELESPSPSPKTATPAVTPSPQSTPIRPAMPGEMPVQISPSAGAPVPPPAGAKLGPAAKPTPKKNTRP
ncbi:hypothetical protein IV102_24195 [bacterium]|nr:hypothetical protein [bacterium]